MNKDKKTLNALLQERYGNSHPPPFNLNETLETLLNHRSVRAYSNKTLPKNTVELLVSAAQSASTSSNLQTWSLVSIKDPDRKNRLAILAGNQEYIRTCPLFLVWLADLSRLQMLGERRNMPIEGLNYLELLTVGMIDAALAAQNAAIAAESIGLNIVYIGGIRNNPEAVASELALPPRIFPVFGMCVGYEDENSKSSIKPRLPQAAVLHQEKYNPSASNNATDEYCKSMNDFYLKQNMKTHGDWGQHSLHRIRGPESLSGRDSMTASLINLGFRLL